MSAHNWTPIDRRVSSGARSITAVRKVMSMLERYTLVATIRTGEVIFLHCSLGPTRKAGLTSESTLPSEYLRANMAGSPLSSRAHENQDEKDTAQPIAKHARKPSTLSSQESVGQQRR